MRLEALLGTIGVEDEAIRAIMRILDENADALSQGPPGEVPQGAFGASDAGGELGHHTSIAHRHVAEAMQELTEGLQGYRVNIDRFHADVTFTDEDAARVLTGIENASQSTQVPDFRGQSSSTADGA